MKYFLLHHTGKSYLYNYIHISLTLIYWQKEPMTTKASLILPNPPPQTNIYLKACFVVEETAFAIALSTQILTF